jgi:hypothetical protein
VPRSPDLEIEARALVAHLALSGAIADEVGETLSYENADDDDKQFEQEQPCGDLAAAAAPPVPNRAEHTGPPQGSADANALSAGVEEFGDDQS